MSVDSQNTFGVKMCISGKNTNELTYVMCEQATAPGGKSITLFGMFSSSSVHEIYHTLIQSTVKSFLDFYHQCLVSDQSRSLDPSIDYDEFLFENAIQYTREAVTESLSSFQDQAVKRAPYDTRIISLMLGVLTADTISVNFSGNALHAWYFHPIYKRHGFSHFADVDILETDAPDRDSGGMFSSLISGKVSGSRSAIFICNSAFQDYFSPQQLKQIITTHHQDDIIPYFEKILSKTSQRHDFAALCLFPAYAGSHEIQTHPSLTQTASNSSMEDLNSTERGTDSILFPALSDQIRTVFLSTFSRIGQVLPSIAAHAVSVAKHLRIRPKSVRSIQIPSKQASNPKEVLKQSHNTDAALVLQKSVHRVYALLTAAVRAVYSSVKKINPHSITFTLRDAQNFLRSLPAKLKEQTVAIQQKISLLSHQQKGLLALAVIFFFLFMQSIFALSLKNSKQARLENARAALKTVSERIDLAEATLIYENDTGAQSLVGEAESLFQNLSPVHNDLSAEYEYLKTRLSAVRGKIYRQVVIETPTPLLSLSPFISLDDSTQLIAMENETLVALANSKVYIISRESTQEVPVLTRTTGITCLIGFTDASVLLCGTRPQDLYRLTINSLRITPLTLVEKKSSNNVIQNAYNDRLYRLDKEAGVIKRFQKTEQGFSGEMLWLKKPAPSLSVAQGMVVDGDIYILTQNGNIHKFRSGEEITFTLEQPTPALTQPKMIASHEKTPLLVVHEPSQKRVVLIDKQSGKIKNQLVSDVFGLGSSIALSPQGAHLSVVKNALLYKIPIK